MRCCRDPFLCGRQNGNRGRGDENGDSRGHAVKLFKIQSKKREYKVAKVFGWLYVILGYIISIVEIMQ